MTESESNSELALVPTKRQCISDVAENPNIAWNKLISKVRQDVEERKISFECACS